MCEHHVGTSRPPVNSLCTVRGAGSSEHWGSYAQLGWSQQDRGPLCSGVGISRLREGFLPGCLALPDWGQNMLETRAFVCQGCLQGMPGLGGSVG
jgi:hypothetical protein